MIEFLDLVFRDSNEPLFALSDEGKAKTIDGIVVDVMAQVSSSNPLVAVRDKLANYVAGTAQFGVLLTTPETSMFHGITGELRSRVRDVAESNTEIKEYFHGLAEAPTNPGEMLDSLYAVHCHRELWMRTYNVARIALGDRFRGSAASAASLYR